MPTKRVTRASTRAAQATAANTPAHLANPIAPIPAPVAANALQPAPTGGASPRRTRSGKIIGMVKTVATKLTRARRAPKAAPIQETVREVDDHVGVAPTTEPATVPQPPAPPRKRGGKAVKKDDNEVQIAANDAAASSSNAAPAPAPTKRSVKRTKSTRSLPSKDKGKARELPIEEAEAPEPAAVPAHVPPAPADASPKPPKPVEDIERVTADIRTLNATLLANDQIAWVDHTYVSHVYENSTLNYVNVPKAAERLVRRAHAEARQATRSRANGPSQTTVPAGARNQGKQNGHRQPPVASTLPATAPSTPEPEPQPEVKPAPLKREAAVNWGYPEYYKERVRKAQEAGGSTSPTALDYPTADERASVASSSSTMPPPAASTSQPITTNGAAPSGNGNAAAASGDSETLPRGRLQRWNAVILGYPDGYTPRNPWPASAIDPTGLTSHPDVVRDESGAIVLPPHLLTARTAALAASVAPPQPPVTPSQPTHATSRSPPPSSSSNESADLAEVEASISIHVDDGDAHPAADLLSPSTQAPLNSTPPASTSSPASTVPRHAPLTRQRAVIFDSRGREIPTHHEDDDAVVQQVIAHVLREVEAERAARPVPLSSSTSASVSAPRVPITRTEAPPVRASAGMSLFAPAAKSNAKGKGKAPANGVLNGNAKGKGKTQGEKAGEKTNARPSNSIFGPKPDKGKKRAREPEPEPAPAPQLWGYTSSTGPMKVRVSLVPVVPSPKRQRVSQSAADGGVASAEAPAVAGAQDESAPTEEENHTLPTATHQGAKRSREEFEEGSSRADTDGEDEDEGEARPAKKLRTRSQQGGES